MFVDLALIRVKQFTCKFGLEERLKYDSNYDHSVIDNLEINAFSSDEHIIPVHVSLHPSEHVLFSSPVLF